MKTIVIINMKGGCAKTTTTINMAYILAARYNKRILLIDNDKQGNLSKSCGVWSYEKPSLSDIITGQQSIKKVQQGTQTDNLKIIPANMHLLATNLEIITNKDAEQSTILSNQLTAVQNDYDYCIIRRRRRKRKRQDGSRIRKR